MWFNNSTFWSKVMRPKSWFLILSLGYGLTQQISFFLTNDLKGKWRKDYSFIRLFLSPNVKSSIKLFAVGVSLIEWERERERMSKGKKKREKASEEGKERNKGREWEKRTKSERERGRERDREKRHFLAPFPYIALTSEFRLHRWRC